MTGPVSILSAWHSFSSVSVWMRMALRPHVMVMVSYLSGALSPKQTLPSASHLGHGVLAKQ